MYKNGPIRKISLISKFTTSQPWKQTISHDIKAVRMKLGQLMEYNKMWWINHSNTLF